MKMHKALAAVALCCAASLADALDLSYVNRMPLPPVEAMNSQLCRGDFQVCWVMRNGKRIVTKDTREEFFGPINAFFLGISAPVIALDGRSTLLNIGRTKAVFVPGPNGGSVRATAMLAEGNWFMRPFVKHPAAFYAAQGTVLVGINTLSCKLRRADRSTRAGKFARAFGFAFPVLYVAGHAYLAKRNNDLVRGFAGPQ